MHRGWKTGGHNKGTWLLLVAINLIPIAGLSCRRKKGGRKPIKREPVDSTVCSPPSGKRGKNSLILLFSSHISGLIWKDVFSLDFVGFS